MRRTWTILAALAALLASAPAAAGRRLHRHRDRRHRRAMQGRERARVSARRSRVGGNLCRGRDAVDRSQPAAYHSPWARLRSTLGQVTLRGRRAHDDRSRGTAGVRVLEIGGRDGRRLADSRCAAARRIRTGRSWRAESSRNTGHISLSTACASPAARASSGGGHRQHRRHAYGDNSLIDDNTAERWRRRRAASSTSAAARPTADQNSTIAFNTARAAAAGLFSSGADRTPRRPTRTVARNPADELRHGRDLLASGLRTRSRSAGRSWRRTPSPGSPSNCGSARSSARASTSTSGADCVRFTARVTARARTPRLRTLWPIYGGDTDVFCRRAVQPGGQPCGLRRHRPARRRAAAGPRCDAGAVELDYEIRIDSGPTWTPPEPRSSSRSRRPARARPSSARSTDRVAPPPSWSCSGSSRRPTLRSLPARTRSAFVRSSAASRSARRRGNSPSGRRSRSPRRIPARLSTRASTWRSRRRPERHGSSAATCSRTERRDRVSVRIPKGWRDLFDGTHRFEVTAFDDAGNRGPTSTVTVVVDRVGPMPASRQCLSRERSCSRPPSRPCSSAGFRARPETPASYRVSRRERYENLDPGRVHVHRPGDRRSRATAGSSPGGRSPSRRRRRRRPRRRSRNRSRRRARRDARAPTPQAGETVVARPISGRILVKRPNTSEFVELRRVAGIPRRLDGRRQERARADHGRAGQRQAAAARRVLRRHLPDHAAGHDVDLTLVEQLAPCSSAGPARRRRQAEEAQAVGRRQGPVPHDRAATARPPCAARSGSSRTPARARSRGHRRASWRCATSGCDKTILVRTGQALPGRRAAAEKPHQSDVAGSSDFRLVSLRCACAPSSSQGSPRWRWLRLLRPTRGTSRGTRRRRRPATRTRTRARACARRSRRPRPRRSPGHDQRPGGHDQHQQRPGDPVRHHGHRGQRAHDHHRRRRQVPRLSRHRRPAAPRSTT